MFPVRGKQKGCIPISGLRNGPLGISKQASETATKPIDVQLLWMSLGDGWGCLFVADGTDMTEGSWNKSLIYNTSISAIGTYIRKCWPQPICILFCLLVSLPKLLYPSPDYLLISLISSYFWPVSLQQCWMGNHLPISLFQISSSRILRCGFTLSSELGDWKKGRGSLVYTFNFTKECDEKGQGL